MWQKSFHLRWNNHLQNLRSLFENLYNEQDFVDVTISCSDGFLHAHKLVLSACSPYFEAVFKENPCKHPTIILKGINRKEMQTLLEYMYVGSVDVHEDDLETLLVIANELHIKGLVNKNESDTQITKIKNVSKLCKKIVKTEQPSAIKEQIPQWQAELTAKNTESNESSNSNKFYSFGGVELEAVNPTEPNQIQVPATKTSEINAEVTENMHLHMKEEIIDEPCEESVEDDAFSSRPQEFCDVSVEPEECEETSENNSGLDDGNILCHICNRSFQNKPSYRRHMQTHTGEKPHQCNYCEQSFLRLSHLQRHIRVHTGERPYACSQCPKHFSRSDKLKQHLVIHHTGLTGKVSKPRGRPRKEVSEQSFNIGSYFPNYLNKVSVNATYNNFNS